MPVLLLLWLVPAPLPNAPSNPVLRELAVGAGVDREEARAVGAGVDRDVWRGVGVRVAREVGRGVGVARLVGTVAGRDIGIGSGCTKLSGCDDEGTSGALLAEGGAIAATGTGSGAVDFRPTSSDSVTTIRSGLTMIGSAGFACVISAHASATCAAAARPRPICSSVVMRARAMMRSYGSTDEPLVTNEIC